jgi:hypothetical protein
LLNDDDYHVDQIRGGVTVAPSASQQAITAQPSGSVPLMHRFQ